MIDLHAHILPEMDDGAEDMSEALEMAELAFESGVNTLVATPHSNQMGRFENFCTEELKKAYKDFCRVLEKEKIPLEILPGMEIFASGEMKDRIVQKKLIGLNRTDYYLIEFPFDVDPYWIGDCLEDVLELNKRPLIAHPERYFCVQDYPELVYEWMQMGCLTQVNKGSVFGRFGRREAHLAQILLNNDLVTCVASDAHRPYARTTYMKDIQEYLEDRFGYEHAYRLLSRNPERIIHGKYIAVHGNCPEKRRRFF